MFEITPPFTNTSHPQDFSYTLHCRSNHCIAANQCSNRSWMVSIFLTFDILLQLIIIGDLCRLVC